MNHGESRTPLREARRTKIMTEEAAGTTTENFFGLFTTYRNSFFLESGVENAQNAGERSAGAEFFGVLLGKGPIEQCVYEIYEHLSWLTIFAESGIIIDNEAILLDSRDVPYAKLYSSAFYLGLKANGDKFSKAIAAPPRAKPVPKDRKPDWVVRDKTTPEQALIYRLSGDYNPLHIDPELGKVMGFGGVILHGLSSYGFAARGSIQAIANGNSRALTVFGARFTSPVKPGDELETSAWEVERHLRNYVYHEESDIWQSCIGQ
ncbi:MaoC like domain-containing protein [Suillus spraguei]|nr:MaoC like domain-containing protein [Suillus spraguei]